MNAFISWSGGKDCLFALHRFLKDNLGNNALFLLNMSDAGSTKSRSHGLENNLLQAQAQALGIPLVQQPTLRGEYEKELKTVVTRLKEQGITAGVFGDIYLQEHRVWIERVCADLEITPLFPLWGMDTRNIMQQFVDEGFRTIVVSVRKGKLPETFLGRIIDNDFLNDIGSIPQTDPCGENGEYHTFVFDGPLFSKAIPLKKEEVWEDEQHWFLKLNTDF